MEQEFHRMSRQTEGKRISQKVFSERVREYLISLTDEAEADRMMKRFHTELEKCRKDQWRPETAGAAVFLGFLHS